MILEELLINEDTNCVLDISKDTFLFLSENYFTYEKINSLDFIIDYSNLYLNEDYYYLSNYSTIDKFGFLNKQIVNWREVFIKALNGLIKNKSVHYDLDNFEPDEAELLMRISDMLKLTHYFNFAIPHEILRLIDLGNRFIDFEKTNMEIER